ncbi:MAG: Rne/Rng family ribonuclease [Dissulfurimicrobium hydrothermale]|uniref:Rne/Rng family ribonuclease n=1 Tax=Dissulfurimicrobium hydrothermale TaxID=1750598 RepID=UPI003C7063A3
MTSELIINTTPWETRLALLENSSVAELHIERQAEKGYVGNIYKGRVVRVLPGMQAAFLDIGLCRTAFIYVTDVYDHLSEFEAMLGQAECAEDPNGCNCNEDDRIDYISTPFRIEDLLHEGQEILVQVIKEPIGTKGARVTSHISIPGRHLVLMPTIDQVGISRKIEDENERQRLKETIDSMRPKGYGFIARTACEGLGPKDIQTEMDFLLHLWENIQRKSAVAPIPSLVYEDLDITLRAIRDLFTGDVERLVVDSNEAHGRILAFVEAFAPHLRPKIELYTQTLPIFDAFGIEVEVSRVFEKKVWLKSGGYIVIESTEALTAIDVNTGKFVGKRHLEDTILKINLEAAREIAYQLRLRNIGGLIIIDFIDMENPASREEVFKTLKEALKKDKSKANILRMSELGLIQMTRKRNREDLNSILCEPCFYCEGMGYLKAKRTICYEIFRLIQRKSRQSKSNKIEIAVHPAIADMLLKEESQHVTTLEKYTGHEIIVVSKSAFHLEQYEITYL